MLRLANEHTITVGNTKTNARGDQLGQGGKVVKTRAQVMKEYHRLDTSMPVDMPIAESAAKVITADNLSDKINIPANNLANPQPKEIPVAESTGYVKPRGSFADAVAKQTEVTQELIDPSILSNISDGIRRI
jgi:hypothetical protein